MINVIEANKELDEFVYSLNWKVDDIVQIKSRRYGEDCLEVELDVARKFSHQPRIELWGMWKKVNGKYTFSPHEFVDIPDAEEFWLFMYFKAQDCA